VFPHSLPLSEPPLVIQVAIDGAVTSLIDTQNFSWVQVQGGKQITVSTVSRLVFVQTPSKLR